MIWNTLKLSPSHLSRATAIFVVDCWQFGTSWIFGLKMEVMPCADLVGDTTEQSCIFCDLIWYYQWYVTLLNCLHYTSAVHQPFLMLIAANLAQSWFLGWKWSSWPLSYWMAVQWSKAVLLLNLHDSINDMKHFRTVCITSHPYHSHFYCWFLRIWP